MNIGEAIKMFRTQRGMLQKDLATRSGMSANALCAIEKDKSFPTKENIKSICRVLEIPVSYLLFSAITEEDIPEDKVQVFNALREPIMKLFEK